MTAHGCQKGQVTGTLNEKLKTIIIADHDAENLTVAKGALGDKYSVFTVPSGKTLLLLLDSVRPDLILLDTDMSDMDGFEVFDILKRNKGTAGIPVIFMSAGIDPGRDGRGMGMGAMDCLTKPFAGELLAKRIGMHLLIDAQKKEIQKYTDHLEMHNNILGTVTELAENRGDPAGRHIEKTRDYLRFLIHCLLEQRVYCKELSALDIDLLVRSSQLHDIGKISISDELLLKHGELTPDEYESVKKHVDNGMRIIEKISHCSLENTFLQYARTIIGSHHEKWDGTGYPLGLKGQQIPFPGRLMAIIDVYDTLTSDRPYKKAFFHEKSVKIIREKSGTHFDPRLAGIFLKNKAGFMNILER